MNTASLNHTFRLVWSDTLQAFIAVAENTKGRGKKSRAGRALSALTAVALAGLALTARAGPADLPTGGNVVAGSGSISQSGKSLTVTQTSARLATDWQSFSIGAGNTVNFVQPSASAVALNRVVGSDVSSIQGAINANGQVFLINPNGVLFTPTAQVNVGSLVASTLALSNADFMAGSYQFEGAAGATGVGGSITNQGAITANGSTGAGGTIALIAAKITNTGSLTAPGGNVLLGAGSQVTLDLGGPVKLQVTQGAIDALIANGGAISANGGLVYLTAKSAGDLTRTVINNTGVIEAHTLATGEKGEIRLMGGMVNDRIEVGGTLDASAPNGGDGGFIETSAHTVSVVDGVKITTASAQGQAGHWLIDPATFTIAASGGDMTGATLSASLGSTDIEIQTTSGSATDGIHINDTVTWSANKTLTLNSWNNIYINAPITVSGTGAGAGVALKYGQGAVNSGNTASYSFGLTSSGFSGSISLPSTGTFTTQLGNDVSPTSYTIITSLGAEGSTTGTDLQGLDTHGSGNFVLGANIDASGTSGWNMVGGVAAGFNPINMLTGTFDGLGHSIIGLAINRPNTDYVGLFSQVQNSSVQNINLANAIVTGHGHVGGIASVATNSNILNVKTSGFVSGNSFVGGVVGMTDLTEFNLFSNLFVTTNVAGIGDQNSLIGGLIGDHYGGKITYATVVNSVIANGASGSGIVGGLVGRSIHTTISNSSHDGIVSAPLVNYAVGGLVGFNYFDGRITESRSSGDVSGFSQVGGLVGYNYGTLSGNVSHSSGNVTGTGDYVGGLVGLNEANNLVSATNAVISTGSGVVTGLNNVGGLVGSQLQGSISGVKVSNTVIGTGNNVGGLVGLLQGSMVGEGSTILSSSSITKSSATGNVRGLNYVGGLVGYMQLGQIDNSYATGAVSGTSDVGGLLGSGISGDISNTYSRGTVGGSSVMGGLIGSIGAATVIKSFWDTQASGQSTSAGGTGKTTAEMKDIGTFSEWSIAGSLGLNDQYASFASRDTIWQIGATATAPVQEFTSSNEAAKVSAQQLAGNPYATLSMSKLILPGSSTGNDSWKGNTGGLRYVPVITEAANGTDGGTTSGSQAIGGAVGAGNESQGGSEPLGFMRVFVVNGGIKLPTSFPVSYNTLNTANPKPSEVSRAAEPSPAPAPAPAPAPERLSRNTTAPSATEL